MDAFLFTLDPLAAWIAAALTATLLGHAALAKFADLSLFEQHLGAYRVPDAALAATRFAIPALELLAAVLLLSPWHALGSSLAIALLLAYAALMAWHRRKGRTLDCGCGGEPLPVSFVLVARNLLLSLIAAAAAVPMSPRAMSLADFAVVAASVLLGALLYAAFHQVLRQAGRGRSVAHSHAHSGSTSTWTH